MPAVINRLFGSALLLFAVFGSGYARTSELSSQSAGEPVGEPVGEPAGARIARDVAYVSRPDGDLLADVHIPAGTGPFAAVITIHGGSWRTGWRWEMNAIARLLTARNIVVMNVTYRLVPAHHWPDQYDDVQAAVRWLRANAAAYRVDPTRIGAWGYSAGAQLALLLAAQIGRAHV